jgi:hypothetical protein
MTMTLIETKTLGTAQAAIEFTSIPQDATDLCVMASLRTTTSGDEQNGTLTFNDSTSGYSEKMLVGYGDSRTSVSQSGSGISWALIATGNSQTSNTFSNSAAYIPNYTSSAAKSVSGDAVSENNATAAQMRIDAALWNNTAAITKVSVTCGSGNFSIGSTISLYKITKGSSGGVVVS